jgi:hypothetical protein
VIVAILLVGAQVVRTAAVAALAPTHPAAAAKLWPDHPSVEISAGLLAIGQASSKQRHNDQRTFAMIDEAATKAPLAPEPFLV